MRTRVQRILIFLGVFVLSHLVIWVAQRIDVPFLIALALVGPMCWYATGILVTRRDLPYIVRVLLSWTFAAVWFIYFLLICFIVESSV